MDWLRSFKIALINKELHTIKKLLESMPQFETIDQMQEAQYLIAQAEALLVELKNKTAQELEKIKKSIAFFQSNPPSQTNHFDTIS